MRLTLVSLFKKSVNGHIFRGKYRLVQRVTPGAVQTLTRDYKQIEHNMALLLRPYLTLEQSSGHAKELNKKAAVIGKWKEQQLKMNRHVTIKEMLEHLNVKTAWE
ncbi:large ribosomal subunit protein mL63 [Topomyia yanbarensis]|uniref:large ribosomal subunit protein mL63 n=1 Tax=Topomyia yanbarensis TaxID=2498891 RepID=UPI00273C4F10|nr:large ribosomal subunit protein mL63 [Topomyia yanbarensis]